MDGMTRALGREITAVEIGGRLYELAPLTVKMAAQIIEFSRARAIRAFYATAKAAGMDGATINAQLTRMNNCQHLEEFQTPEAVAYTLALRCARATGGEVEKLLADIELIPLGELLAQQDVILEAGEEERAEVKNAEFQKKTTSSPS